MPLSPAALSLAVYAPGLLGASLLRDARRLGFKELRVWARAEKSLAAVAAAGLADFTSTEAAAVACGAHIIVLACPVEHMPGLASSICETPFPPGTLVTDVGSVKGMVMREVAPIFAQAGATFIGSHPMAGSHKTGLAASQEGLYKDAVCLLTQQSETRPEDMERMEAFWHLFGSRCVTMDAALHDHIVARISHLPHMAAVLATLAALRREPSYAAFAAGGLRDTTRVAEGNPSMWAGILLHNSEAVILALRDLITDGAALLRSLETKDHAALRALLTEAHTLRIGAFPAPVVGSTST